MIWHSVAGEGQTICVISELFQVSCSSLTSSVPLTPLIKDDKMLMIWDLYPDSPAQTGARGVKIAVHQPTAYAIQFSHPLTSIDSHESSDKEFLVADCRGSIYLIDWRSESEIAREQDFRHSNIVELVDPSAVISSAGSFGSAAWRPGDANM